MFEFKIEKENGETLTITQNTETLIQKLDRLAVEAGFNDISPNAIHIFREPDQPTGVTLVFNRGEEAYTLASPVAASVRVYNAPGRNQVPVDYVGVVGLKRILISYSALARINNAVDMQRVMGPLVNEAVKDFIDEFGFISLGYRISASRPGYDNSSYFRDMDDTAAMEFRLCLIKE